MKAQVPWKKAEKVEVKVILKPESSQFQKKISKRKFPKENFPQDFPPFSVKE
jgi:hypothetical protein